MGDGRGASNAGADGRAVDGGEVVITPTLVLEAFGQGTPGTAVIVAKEEEFYSGFHARGYEFDWPYHAVLGSTSLSALPTVS